jgi:hypothetical protein
LVVSRVSGTTKAFLNGTEVVSYSDSSNYIAGRLNLGLNNPGPTYYYFNGYISDFKVVIGTGTTSGTPPASPATATSGTQALLNFTNAAIVDSSTRHVIETAGIVTTNTSVKKYGTSSMYFNGASGTRLVLERTPSLNLTGDFTVEGWFFCDSLESGTYRRLWSFGNFSESNSFDAEFNNNEVSNKFRINFNGLTNGANSSETSTNAIATNQWYHVAVTRSSGTIKGWLNGTNVITITGSQTAFVNRAQDVYIGSLHGYETTAGAIWSGYIDDFRITNGLARYTSTFTPPTGPFPRR